MLSEYFFVFFSNSFIQLYINDDKHLLPQFLETSSRSSSPLTIENMMDSIYFINNSNLTNIQSLSSQSSINYPDDKLFELTWNEILYDGGLAAWTPRSSFRWLTICICLIGFLGKINLFSIFIFRFFQEIYQLPIRYYVHVCVLFLRVRI